VSAATILSETGAPVTTPWSQDGPDHTAWEHRAVQIPFVWQMADTLRSSDRQRNRSIDSAAIAEAAKSFRTTLGSFRFVLDEMLLDR